MITEGLQPFVNTPTGHPLFFLGLATYLRATAEGTGGGFGLVEQPMPPGFASPYHLHRNEDEAFYVLEGQMAFVCDGRWTAAGPGTFVFGPRNVPHGFKVAGDTPARMLLLCSPGGFEQFVVEMSDPAPAPPDMVRLMTVAARYGIEILGPLPEGVPAQAAVAPPALRDEAAAVRLRHVAAVRTGDLATLADLFAADAALMAPGRPVLRGAGVGAWFSGLVASATVPDFDLRPDGADVHGDAVVEFGSWSGTMRPTNGGPEARIGGTYVTVYARGADGAVRIVRDCFNGMGA